MPESGGPATQDGIHYQNSVAVLAMLDMLDMNPAPARFRVTDVRIEAPEQVDDIVIRHADGTAIYQNVKLELRSGTAWDKLWKQLAAQRASQRFGGNDTIQVVVANSTQLFEDCVEMSNRAQAEDVDEWAARLTERQLIVLNGIVKQVGSRDAALVIFQNAEFLHWSRQHVEAEFNRRRLAAGGPAGLPSTLRDIVSGGARRRAHYRAGPLRLRLALEHNMHLVEPPAWGLPAYREAIRNEGIITIPGTGRSGTVDELFVWPTAREFQAGGFRGFEDEDPGYWREPFRDRVDLRDFPQPELDRVVVVAGPGYGKSALLTALASGLARGPFVPVEIPLALLAKSGANVLSFVEAHLADEYGLAADWRRLAEQGLLVLLYDGLDEIPASVRPLILQRIARFSSVCPHCPWLLTARDPAVVGGLPDARLVELTPLSDGDIASFAAVIARQLDSIDGAHFVNRLRQYPDLNRLARIPLFLSMLLATTDPQNLEPISRSDLIEAYLKTLISPAEHKIVSDELPAPSIRTIAQDIAYRKLEAQEIGASEAEVRTVIAQHAPDPVVADRIFQVLRSNGILQAQGPARLRFPYPIVQEYLAACHLLDHEADSLSSRIDNAVSRPWAQVMQFAIERHPSPEPLIQAILVREDDAFRTGLRLVGRCVANGAAVTAATRRSIGRRLVTAWRTAPSRAREAIGRLLCDGFTDVNLDELYDAVHKPWLQDSCAGDIVAKINSPDLTISVLSSLIREDNTPFKVYRSLRPAIKHIQVRALDLVRDLILEVEDEETRGARSSALTNFETHPDLAPVASELAQNPEIPLEGRLLAYALIPGTLAPEGENLLYAAMVSRRTRPSFAATRLLTRLESPQRYIEDALHSDAVSDEQRLALVQTLAEVFPDAHIRRAFIAKVRDGVHEADINLRSALDVMAAAAGDESAFARLVSNMEKNPVSSVSMTISMFGNFRDPYLAEEAAAQAQARFFSPEDLVRMSHAAEVGMLYNIELSFGFTGILHSAQPHPGIERWAALVEDWSANQSLTDLQRVQILTASSRLGSEEARSQLEQILEGIGDPNEPMWNDGGSMGATLGRAVSELRRRKPLLDKDFLDRLIRANQVNLVTAGINALSAHGDRDALERLLAAHREGPGWHEKDNLANAIELLSLKLGIVIRLVGRKYELQDGAKGS